MATAAQAQLQTGLREFLSLTRELMAAVASEATPRRGDARTAQGLGRGQLPPPQRRGATEVMRALVQADQGLCAAAEQLDRSVLFERRCLKMRRAVAREDAAARELLAVLRSAEGRLERAIERAAPVVEASRAARGRPSSVEDLMYVARNVAHTTRSRPGFEMGMNMKGFFPPKPLSTEMCSGWLMHECVTHSARCAASAATQRHAGIATAANFASMSSIAPPTTAVPEEQQPIQPQPSVQVSSTAAGAGRRGAGRPVAEVDVDVSAAGKRKRERAEGASADGAAPPQRPRLEETDAEGMKPAAAGTAAAVAPTVAAEVEVHADAMTTEAPVTVPAAGSTTAGAGRVQAPGDPTPAGEGGSPSSTADETRTKGGGQVATSADIEEFEDDDEGWF